MKTVIIALLCGVLFGLGLAVSEMIKPQRVIGFLDITGDWDATLLFVMGGALVVGLPCFQIALKRKPVCSEQFDLPSNMAIDRPLLIGAILFGVGWGLSGLCPGPAIAGMATLSFDIIGFVLAMIVGQVCVMYWNRSRR
ncbi:MAG: YeeE/YedE family protein [Cellvibrionaceae bacterium]|nr:YeeE/YedE family protein [Cellvibrionaceae bacterium]